MRREARGRMVAYIRGKNVIPCSLHIIYRIHRSQTGGRERSIPFAVSRFMADAGHETMGFLKDGCLFPLRLHQQPDGERIIPPTPARRCPFSQQCRSAPKWSR